MSSITVVLKWGDGEYAFALRLPQIEELQRLTGVGFGALVNRVLAGEFYIRDVRETIRLGLIGGGTSPVRAVELVNTYVDGQPLASPDDPANPLAVAQSVLLASYSGIEESEKGDEDAGEQEAGMADTSTSRPSEQPSSEPTSLPETSKS